MDSFDHFLPDATWRGVLKFECKLAQFSEVCPTLNHQYVTVVSFSANAWF